MAASAMLGGLWSDVSSYQVLPSPRARRQRHEIVQTRSDRLVANGKSGVPRTVDPARKPPTGHKAMGDTTELKAEDRLKSVAAARWGSSLQPATLGG